MPRRINPVVLLGLTIAIALSLALSAGAQSGGGSPGDAVGAAMGQVGKPYVFGTDGPDTFSCAGLVRFALRSAGVDENAPWGHGEYLGAYPNVSSPKPGDVVVYPHGVAMYVSDGTVVQPEAIQRRAMPNRTTPSWGCIQQENLMLRQPWIPQR